MGPVLGGMDAVPGGPDGSTAGSKRVSGPALWAAVESTTAPGGTMFSVSGDAMGSVSGGAC
jgi:hypothetical protein